MFASFINWLTWYLSNLSVIFFHKRSDELSVRLWIPLKLVSFCWSGSVCFYSPCCYTQTVDFKSCKEKGFSETLLTSWKWSPTFDVTLRAWARLVVLLWIFNCWLRGGFQDEFVGEEVPFIYPIGLRMSVHISQNLVKTGSCAGGDTCTNIPPPDRTNP